MIDVHAHILPKMDDGSKDPEESAALLELLGQQGVTTVVATPHFYASMETPEAFLKRRQEAAARLLPPSPGQPRICFGAEVAYFSGIGSCEAVIPLQIENTKLLLVEMPFCDWTDRIVREVCDITMQLGLIPVLAHVNRYLGKQQFPRYMDTLLQSGVLFQCNAEAFEDLRHRRWALKLLKKGCIHFLGSDCHNLTSRPPKLRLAREAIEKKLGDRFLADFAENAAQILFPDKM